MPIRSDSVALLHRAFVDEPFIVEMYGDETLDRWAGSWTLYSSMRRASWQFHQNIAEVHRPLDARAWIDKVATEKALRGHGVARRLLDAAADALKHDAPAELVLGCAPPDPAAPYTG